MADKAFKGKITAQGTEITVLSGGTDDDYISLTDIARYKNSDYPSEAIQNWMRNRSTVEFLGLWEQIHNPDFNCIEFEVIKCKAGRNSFTITPKRWIETVGAIGMTSKQGRYAATLAHKDIAFKFAAWISAEFELYIIKDYRRLKSDESIRISLDLNINQIPAAGIVRDGLSAPELTAWQRSFVCADESGLLNVLFGQTAADWRRANPDSFTQQLGLTLRETAPEYVREKTPDQIMQIASIVRVITAKTVEEANSLYQSIKDVNDETTRKAVQNSIISQTIQQLPEHGLKKEDLFAVVEAAIETCAQLLTENVIPIPQAVIQPHTEKESGFYDFKLDTSSMRFNPSDDTLPGTVAFSKIDTVENEIVRHIIVRDNVDYASCSDLIHSLIADAKEHFLSFLNNEEAEKVMRDRQHTIAEIVYAQMNEHFYKEELSYKAVNIRPFTRIEPNYGGKIETGEIYDLRTPMAASEVKSKIFSGFRKAGHTLYKFDSDTERTFAIVLENDIAVLRWLRPAPRQFNIYRGQSGASRYEPAFIVETADFIYMCELKANKNIKDADVLEEKEAAVEYCRAASKFNTENGGKPWKYLLISHEEIRPQASFTYLVKRSLGTKS